MLKSMRRNKQFLKFFLWAVIATFIVSIFVYFGASGQLGEKGGSGTLVFIGKHKISQEAYTAALRQRIEAMRKQYPDLNKTLIQQLNLPQQTLEEMVTQTLLLDLAKAMNLAATDVEILDKIHSYPVFQRDGKFVGADEYRRILNWNRISISDFENSLRTEVLLTKVVRVLTSGVAVIPDEIWENYRKENETAKLEYLVLEKDKVNLETQPSEAELQAHFEKNKASYQVPEKREAEFIVLIADDLKKEIKVVDTDIASYYKDNIAQFKTPETIRVSRIWFSSEGRDPALVRAEAQTVLDRLSGGEDFAALAKKFSKDAKTAQGGDWGITEWRSLGQAEQDAVAKLAAGAVSGLVESEGGLAVLKVTEKTAEATQSLDEVKGRVKTILEDEKARALADERIAELAKRARREKSLDVAAQRLNLKTRKTGLLKSGQAFEEIDPSGSISTALFGLKEKDISDPIYTYNGVALAQLQRIAPAHPGTFAEVKDEVNQDVTLERKKARIRERINALRTRLVAETKKSWEDIAKEEGVEFKAINEHKREQYIGTIGENAHFDAVAFSLPLQAVSEPIEYENGFALLRVLERKEVSQADLEKVQAAERDKLLEAKKNKFLQSFLAKAREEKKVRIKYDLFLKLNSDLLARFGD